MPSTPSNIIVPILTPGGDLVRPIQQIPPGVQQYIDNGLTYQSNNSDFITRDDKGNIIITANNQNNQNLVLEPVALRYVNKSVVNNIDTRFKYFKFPIENIAVPEISFDLNDVIDPIFAFYEPSNNFTIQSENIITGILMDVVRDGLPQLNTNRYFITNLINDAGVDLRFRIRLNHRFTNLPGTVPVPGSVGTLFFTIIKSEANTGETIRDFIVLTENSDAEITLNETSTKEYDIIIPSQDFNVGDSFSIGAIAGQSGQHTVLQLGSYWSITNAELDVNINNESN